MIVTRYNLGIGPKPHQFAILICNSASVPVTTVIVTLANGVEKLTKLERIGQIAADKTGGYLSHLGRNWGK